MSFASHGELEGRTPIGWQEFFPAIDMRDLAVVADEDAGTLSLVPSEKVASVLGGDDTQHAPASH